jgi:hypothetical protein
MLPVLAVPPVATEDTPPVVAALFPPFADTLPPVPEPDMLESGLSAA